MVSIYSVDLNLLVVLHTVLAERNVARAAERLHVTPSAVSNSLARLRDVLSDPLVTRKGRGIVPTPRAAELAPTLARVIREIEGVLHGAPFDAAACTRTFSLAVADAGQIAWVPAIAARMGREMPQAQVRVVSIDSLLSLGDLTSSEIDLHLGIRGSGAGLHAEPLCEEKTILVARRNHSATKRRMSREQLGRLHHVRIDMVPARNFPDALAGAYQRAGIERRVVMTVPSFSAAAAVVAATDLVATMPSSFLAAEKARSLRPVRGPVPAKTLEMTMCWHERTHTDPAAVAFRELVRRSVLESRRAIRS